MHLRLALAIALLFAGLSATRAFAQDEAREAPGADRAYLAKVQGALDAIREGRHDEALEALREAKSENPGKPHAAYYEAVALQAKGDLDGAVQAFRAARVLASNADSARFEARALQGAAMVLERDPEKRAEAKLAWEELEAFLASHPDAGVASVPGARLEKMKQVSETEANAEVVRRAVAAREEELRQQEAEKAKKAKKKKRRR